MGNLVDINRYTTLFSGKRVFVTGDTGFKGSWLTLWLKDLGADVVGYALPPKRAHDHFNLMQLDRLIHHVDGDIRDLSHLSKVVTEFQPEIFFHLAAQPLVRYSYEDPKTTIDTNVGGSTNILEVVRSSTSLKALVYVTSDKCYKNNEWVWGYRETDRLGGHDPYSASKAAAEIIFDAYSKSYFVRKAGFAAASVRAGNVIGGSDWSEDRIVPDCIRCLNEKRPVILRNPTATRPWQHVMEPLSGYLLLASSLYQGGEKFGGAWNFGPSSKSIKTVNELAKLIVHYWGSGEIEVQVQADAPHESGLLQLNCDRASSLLGWAPRWGFDRSIKETVMWYKQQPTTKDVRSLTLGQIKAYMESSHD